MVWDLFQKHSYIERSFTMIYSKEVELMCPVAKGAKHEPAPIPEEGDVYKRQAW